MVILLGVVRFTSLCGWLTLFVVGIWLFRRVLGSWLLLGLLVWCG